MLTVIQKTKFHSRFSISSLKIGCFEDVIKTSVFQSRLAEYGFAARYKGPIGKKAVEEMERSVSLEAEQFSDSGNKTFFRNRTTLNYVNPYRTGRLD